MALAQGAELVALDTETTSLDEMQAKLVGLSMAVAPGVACYIPVAHRGPDGATQLPKDEVLARLRPWLEDASRPKLLHHAKYDTHVFANEGIRLAGIAEDTMLQAYVLESHRGVGLNDLAQRYLGRSGVSYEDLCGKGAKQIGFDEVAVDKAGHYAAEDADFTLQLHRVLRPQVAADAGLERIYLLEMQVSAVLTTIERNGVKVDAAELGRQSHKLGQEMLQLEQKAYELAGQPFNLNSPKQLGEILFGRMQLPVVRKTAGGAPSTDEEVLSKLAQDYPLPQVLLEYRGLSKLKSTYTDKLPRMLRSSRAAWLRPIPICRTSPCAPKPGAGCARRSSPSRACCCRPTIRRSNCASWRTCRTTPICSAPSPPARTSIVPRPRKCSACRWRTCLPSSGARPRPSTSA